MGSVLAKCQGLLGGIRMKQGELLNGLVFFQHLYQSGIGFLGGAHPFRSRAVRSSW